jgi:hypothetical protein
MKKTKMQRRAFARRLGRIGGGGDSAPKKAKLLSLHFAKPGEDQTPKP